MQMKQQVLILSEAQTIKESYSLKAKLQTLLQKTLYLLYSTHIDFDKQNPNFNHMSWGLIFFLRFRIQTLEI